MRTSTMKDVIRALLLPTAAVALMSVAGCEEKGPAERTGERIDEAVEEAGEEIDEAADDAAEELDEINDGH